MLKSIRKFLNAGETAQPSQADKQEEVVNMTVEKEGQTVMAADVNTAELVANLATATESLANVQAQFAELTSKYEAAQAALNAIEAEKAALVADAAAKKLAARKERIEMAVGTEKAPALLAATEKLEDEQFEAIVGAMAASFEVEASSKMFKEVGVTASETVLEADPINKLAANLAAKFK